MKHLSNEKKSNKPSETGFLYRCAPLFFACSMVCLPSIAYGSLTLLERGQVLLLGAENAAEEAAKIEKHLKTLRTRALVLEKQVDARAEGWRRAALEISRLENEMREMREAIRKKKKQEKELLKRGIEILSSEFHHEKNPVSIDRYPEAYLILGKAMAKTGRHLDAAGVFRRLEGASVAAEIKQNALDARIAVLDRAVGGLKLPDPPDPETQKTKPARKQLPKAIRLFHEALDKYINLNPDGTKSALYAYWMGSHEYLYGRYVEARRRFMWIIRNHCQSETALEAGRIILQSVVLQRADDHLEQLLKTVKHLRRIKCWRNRRCKKADKKCLAWSRRVGQWMLELAELEERVEKRVKFDE